MFSQATSTVVMAVHGGQSSSMIESKNQAPFFSSTSILATSSYLHEGCYPSRHLALILDKIKDASPRGFLPVHSEEMFLLETSSYITLAKDILQVLPTSPYLGETGRVNALIFLPL